MSRLKPQRFGNVPDGLPPYHREFLTKVRDALEILMGAKRSQSDTAIIPRSQAVTFADLDDGTDVTAVSPSTPEYANNAAAIAGGLKAGQLYRTGDALKIVH
jgi:hypothetical protein